MNPNLFQYFRYTPNLNSDKNEYKYEYKIIMDFPSHVVLGKSAKSLK
jgi:hypothetical protein